MSFSARQALPAPRGRARQASCVVAYRSSSSSASTVIASSNRLVPRAARTRESTNASSQRGLRCALKRSARLAEQLLRRVGKGRLGLPPVGPDQREPAARTENARDLRERHAPGRTSGTPRRRRPRRRSRPGAGSPRPSPRAPRRRAISARIASFGSTATTWANRAASSCVKPAGSGGEVEHAGVTGRARDSAAPIQRLVASTAGGRGGTARRRARSSGGAAVQPTPASRNARFSLSICRAMTRRWIWFVPS